MENKEKVLQNQMLINLMSRKQKLLERREVVMLKSPRNRLNDVDEKGIGIDSPETLFSNEQPSISPPPFSRLTPLTDLLKQKYEVKLQDEPDSNALSDISLLLGPSPLLKNLINDDSTSSPLRPMSPETQELYDVLAQPGFEIANSPCDSYHGANDDGVKDPDFVIEDLNQGANHDPETDCESCDEIHASTLKTHTNEIHTQRNIHKINTKDTSKTQKTTSIENEEERAEKQKVIPDLHVQENTLHEIAATSATSDINTVADSRNKSTTLTKETENTSEKATKKKKKVRSRKEKQESKILRNTGKSYVTEKGKVVPDRKSKDLSACRLKCAERISVTEQKQCFKDYWKLGQRDRRAAFISKSVTILPKKSQKTDSMMVNRDCCVYNLWISGEDKPVCKECLCRLLGETKGFINVIIEKKKQSPTGIIDTDQRGCKPPKNKKTIEELSFARNHISSFTSYESHYCRKSTGKKYLPADLSISKMYREYKNSIQNPVSLKLYAKCFHDLNLSFKQPSKDTCNTCDVLNAKIKVADGDRKTQLSTELAEHQSQAEKAYNEKRVDKDIIKSNTSVRAFAFDLQQCLPTPYLKTSVSFYKRQLWSFNLTIHDLANNEATCYMWDKTIGARGANQIGSCLWHFCKGLAPEVKEVIFYSDRCVGQNKNNFVAMMFMYLLHNHPTLETISHKFLISGHTHMECDSDRDIIEK